MANEGRIIVAPLRYTVRMRNASKQDLLHECQATSFIRASPPQHHSTYRASFGALKKKIMTRAKVELPGSVRDVGQSAIQYTTGFQVGG